MRRGGYDDFLVDIRRRRNADSSDRNWNHGKEREMVKRTCQKCGKEWFSAYEQGEWKCENCGEVLKPELNKPAK
jgi:ribosomal protein L37AE/L43A